MQKPLHEIYLDPVSVFSKRLIYDTVLIGYTLLDLVYSHK